MMDGIPADWRDTYETQMLYTVALNVSRFPCRPHRVIPDGL